MTCASEGAVDVYIEPFVRARCLVVVGSTPVAEALARLARGLDYEVVRVVEADEQRDLEPEVGTLGITVAPLQMLPMILKGDVSNVAAVVASQGHYDEPALEAIFNAGVSYVGLVASRKRGGTVCAGLEARGVPNVAAIHCPAGLYLGAKTAPEVALSILGEIVKTASNSVSTGEKIVPGPISAVDPICGMEVDVATARHTAEIGGATYYFCCPHCRAQFISLHPVQS
jgi:xanthine dehydrogenase accessory factor